MISQLPWSLILITLVLNVTVGLGVAPVLFREITDWALAGSIAGILFMRSAEISLGTLGLAFVLVWRTGSKRVEILLLGLSILGTALGRFVLAPKIAALRSLIHHQGGMALAPIAMREEFQMMHAVSSILFLLVLVALFAILFLQGWARRRPV